MTDTQIKKKIKRILKKGDALEFAKLIIKIQEEERKLLK